jgi:hypothetical protein
MSTYVAFAAGRLIARGDLTDVARAAKAATDAGEPRVVQVFDDRTSEPRDLDLGGSMDDVLARLRGDDDHDGTNAAAARVLGHVGAHAVAGGAAVATAPARTGPGRPKLGVVAREVTLLPRHWAWLNDQPGGASAALRRLVDEARTTHAARDELRRARDAVYRFLLATLGDAYGFEEAMRALYADDEDRFIAESAPWPPDLRTHALRLARAVFHPKVA